MKNSGFLRSSRGGQSISNSRVRQSSQDSNISQIKAEYSEELANLSSKYSDLPSCKAVDALLSDLSIEKCANEKLREVIEELKGKLQSSDPQRNSHLKFDEDIQKYVLETETSRIALTENAKILQDRQTIRLEKTKEKLNESERELSSAQRAREEAQAAQREAEENLSRVTEECENELASERASRDEASMTLSAQREETKHLSDIAKGFRQRQDDLLRLIREKEEAAKAERNLRKELEKQVSELTNKIVSAQKKGSDLKGKINEYSRPLAESTQREERLTVEMKTLQGKLRESIELNKTLIKERNDELLRVLDENQQLEKNLSEVKELIETFEKENHDLENSQLNKPDQNILENEHAKSFIALCDQLIAEKTAEIEEAMKNEDQRRLSMSSDRTRIVKDSLAGTNRSIFSSARD